MTCPVCGAGNTEMVKHCPACKSEWYGGNNDMEKVYRVLGVALLVLLLTAIGVLAVNNVGFRRELAELRRDYSEMFPAYAGMNRCVFPNRRPATNVPRVCGDEPSLIKPEQRPVECSPRMRG